MNVFNQATTIIHSSLLAGMIVIDDTKSAVNATAPQGQESIVAPPPTFEESIEHDLLDYSHARHRPPVGEDSPPGFTPYEAEFFRATNGSIISHDPHLNEDGTI